MLRVRRRKNDDISVELGIGEALVLKTLPGRLRSRLANPDFTDGVTRRLFPPAYGDASEETEYRRLLGDDLRRRKLEGIDLFERTLSCCRFHKRRVEICIRAAEFELWLGFINDTRLLLGCELGIENDDWGREFDPEHPQAEDLALLHFLTWLEDELVRSTGFPMPDIDPRNLKDE